MSAIAINSAGQDFVSFDIKGRFLGEVAHRKKVAEHAEAHYGQLNEANLFDPTRRKTFGYCAQVAGFESLSAFGLVLKQRSGAIVGNLSSTLSEFGQVFYADYMYNKERAKLKTLSTEKAEELREKLNEKAERNMGALAALGGAAGLWEFQKDIREYFSGGEVEAIDAPIWQKAGLTAASLISAGLMFVNWGDKSTTSLMVGEGESGSMMVDARSDSRCTAEWLGMSLYTWFSGFAPFKLLLDGLIPAAGLFDGVDAISGGKLKGLFKSSSDEKKEERSPISRLFFSKWFLGTKDKAGFKQMFHDSILSRFYGSQSPVVFMGNDGKMQVKVEAEEAPVENKSRPPRPGVDKIDEDGQLSRAEGVPAITSA